MKTEIRQDFRRNRKRRIFARDWMQEWALGMPMLHRIAKNRRRKRRWKKPAWTWREKISARNISRGSTLPVTPGEGIETNGPYCSYPRSTAIICRLHRNHRMVKADRIARPSRSGYSRPTFSETRGDGSSSADVYAAVGDQRAITVIGHVKAAGCDVVIDPCRQRTHPGQNPFGLERPPVAQRFAHRFSVPHRWKI